MKPSIASLTCFLAFASARAQDRVDFDPKLAADWKSIGAKIGWLQEGKRAWHLYHDRKPDQPELSVLPAIRMTLDRPFEFGLLASMPAPPMPFAFDFHGTSVGARELRELHDFKNLVALNADGVPLTDADFKEIASLRGLKTLYVRYAKVTDEGMKAVAGLTKLQAIDLSCVKISDESLRHFASMPDLECMDLQFTSIRGTGFKDLVGLKKLRHLSLNESATDAGLLEVGKLKHLEYLSLWHAQVTDRGLQDLVGLPALKNIDLADTRVTDAGMKTLSAIKSLETVQLYRTKITDACLASLATLPNLRVLCLPIATTSEEAVARFQKAHPKVTIHR